jgi:osmotically-inducible protein OsmY
MTEEVAKTELAEKVSSALTHDERTAEYPIGVADDEGVITLTGEVDDLETHEAAEEIAADQEGVVEVINDLEVTGEEAEDEPGTSASPAVRQSTP